METDNEKQPLVKSSLMGQLELVDSDSLTDTHRELRAFLKEHPFVAQQLTFSFNRLRSLLRTSIEMVDEQGGDAVDITRSLGKEEGEILRLGIPLLDTSEDWMKARKI